MLKGSDMLPGGGSYISLVSNGGCAGAGSATSGRASTGRSDDSSGGGVDYTLVVQTMEHDMSQCFKDARARFLYIFL
jgi:hypothetical protein